MKTPKRLKFTPSAKRQQQQQIDVKGLANFIKGLSVAAGQAGAALNKIADAVRSVVAAFTSFTSSDELHARIRENNMYWESWKQTELALLLERNSISHRLRG